jgi:hypothetical protein
MAREAERIRNGVSAGRMSKGDESWMPRWDGQSMPGIVLSRFFGLRFDSGAPLFGAFQKIPGTPPMAGAFVRTRQGRFRF